MAQVLCSRAMGQPPDPPADLSSTLRHVRAVQNESDADVSWLNLHQKISRWVEEATLGTNLPADLSLDDLTQDVLLQVQEQTAATVVFVTHDLDEAIYLADRVLVLGGEPGGITLELRTGLCRPRDQIRTRESEPYLRARQRLGDLLAVGRR